MADTMDLKSIALMSVRVRLSSRVLWACKLRKELLHVGLEPNGGRAHLSGM